MLRGAHSEAQARARLHRYSPFLEKTEGFRGDHSGTKLYDPFPTNNKTVPQTGENAVALQNTKRNLMIGKALPQTFPSAFFFQPPFTSPLSLEKLQVTSELEIKHSIPSHTPSLRHRKTLLRFFLSHLSLAGLSANTTEHYHHHPSDEKI